MSAPVDVPLEVFFAGFPVCTTVPDGILAVRDRVTLAAAVAMVLGGLALLVSLAVVVGGSLP